VSRIGKLKDFLLKLYKICEQSTYNDEFCRRLEKDDLQKIKYNFERERENKDA